jgi:hypothetical protein
MLPPAVTPIEIAGRLSAIAKNLDSTLASGKAIDPEKIRRLSLRLRRYAQRLRKAPTSFSIY